ncbi:farnesol dehydrogenase-like [Zerene cesonia]|uniref:farnesol dehydrogenase-like n=1 Tax=Zerene cesonia TaxID=33412 RepID=UPI0018E545E4|nr:farnesol dehydrogenase-like [Zerene cesonia]
MERWSGKTAVVTGASSGIGAAISVKLADAGFRVVGLARSDHLVDQLQAKVTGDGNITSLKCDIAKSEEIAMAFQSIEENFAGIHVLVNNAGVIYPAHITDVGDSPMSNDEVISTLDVNVKGMILCTRHAVASMKKQNFNGHIVNINSVAGHYIPFLPNINVYSASKHAVTAFTKSLLNELAQFGSSIKVTGISPGLVRTKMAQRDGVEIDLPMLEPSDVADTVLYALSTPPAVNITELTVQRVSEKRI